ncbi:MAG TPA: hypothetical protein VF952_19010 [Chloroflexia bacterium]
MSTDMGKRSDDSEVFLVRLWAGGPLPHQEPGGIEDSEDSEDRVQGKVTHLLSGEASKFDDLSTLVNLLLRRLPPTRNDEVASSE